jgi:hypothetical protein
VCALFALCTRRGGPALVSNGIQVRVQERFRRRRTGREGMSGGAVLLQRFPRSATAVIEGLSGRARKGAASRICTRLFTSGGRVGDGLASIAGQDAAALTVAGWQTPTPIRLLPRSVLMLHPQLDFGHFRPADRLGMAGHSSAILFIVRDAAVVACADRPQMTVALQDLVSGHHRSPVPRQTRGLFPTR